MKDNAEVVDQGVDRARIDDPIFPTWGDLLAIVGIFMVVQLTTMFIFSALGLSTLPPADIDSLDALAQRYAEQYSGKMVFYWSIISQPMMLLSVIAYRLMRCGNMNGIKISMRGFDPTILLWGILIVISLDIVINPLMEQLPPSIIPSGRGVYMILSLAVVAPLFEELLCRGVILESIRRKRGALMACFVSALIFGLMHFEARSSLNAFVIGILLGYLYLRTNSIFAPMLLHSVNNILAYFFLLFGLADKSVSDIITNNFAYTVVYGVAVAILLISLFSISRYITRLNRDDRANR